MSTESINSLAMAAYVKVLEASKSKLMSLGARRGIPPWDAEEMFQEASFSVYKRLGKIEIKSIEAYLTTAFSNRIVDYYRTNLSLIHISEPTRPY